MESKHPVLKWVHGEGCEPFEYRCSDCGQLRLSYVKTNSCGNCGSDKIVKGKPNTLERSNDNGLEGQNEGLGRR